MLVIYNVHMNIKGACWYMVVYMPGILFGLRHEFILFSKLEIEGFCCLS